jgi:hypothetical protein
MRVLRTGSEREPEYPDAYRLLADLCAAAAELIRTWEAA